jgi:hypothetical protein
MLAGRSRTLPVGVDGYLAVKQSQMIKGLACTPEIATQVSCSFKAAHFAAFGTLGTARPIVAVGSLVPH